MSAVKLGSNMNIKANASKYPKKRRKKSLKFFRKLEFIGRKRISRSMLFYYFTNPKNTGAFCSSSKKLSFAMTDNIGIENARNIIEIGPGMGVFTEVIMRRKASEAKFFAVEINSKIAKELKSKIHRLDIEVNSAQFLPQIMQDRQMLYADIIISGIPWALLTSIEQDEILQSIYNALRVGGYFTTFAYIIPSISARRFRNKLNELFVEVKISKVIWQNIPPAFVYYCKK